MSLFPIPFCMCSQIPPLLSSFLKQQVHVSGNELGQAGGEAMAAALRANDTLETLEIGNVLLRLRRQVEAL